jgi:SAM-dependent methyltransferase
MDPTRDSIAAYTAGAEAYARDHAGKRAAEVARFAAWLPVPSRVLDAGCGPGRDLARFAAHGHDPVGVELNPAFLVAARRHAPVVELDLRELPGPFGEGSIDGIWADAALVHLPVSEAEAVLTAFARLLRPGGRLFVSVRSEGRPGWVDEPDARRWYHVWPAREAAAAVTASGFELDEVVPGPYTQIWAIRLRTEELE